MKSIRKFHIVTVCFLHMLVTSCKKENMGDCTKSSGKLTTEYRSIDTFDELELDDNINLLLVKDTLNHVTIEAGSNLMALIRTDIKGNKLSLKNDNRCNWVRDFNLPVNITLYCSGWPATITYRGSGNLVSKDTLEGNSFVLDIWAGTGTVDLKVDVTTITCASHTGSADVFLSGKTGVSYIWSAGTGYIRAGNLESGFTFIGSKSSADCNVKTSKEIQARIFGSGNVYYTGNPLKIAAEHYSTGRLLRLE
jgi:hypothetical protein